MPPQARREAVSSLLRRLPACAASAEPPSLGLERPRAGSISHQASAVDEQSAERAEQRAGAAGDMGESVEPVGVGTSLPA